jgi:hypothetical protein
MVLHANRARINSGSEFFIAPKKAFHLWGEAKTTHALEQSDTWQISTSGTLDGCRNFSLRNLRGATQHACAPFQVPYVLFCTVALHPAFFTVKFHTHKKSFFASLGCSATFAMATRLGNGSCTRRHYRGSQVPFHFRVVRAR